MKPLPAVTSTSTNRFIGSILLISGTSIGAGMLALPVSTAAYGFFPSVALFVICWAFMTLSGLLLLEVNLWLKPGANIISMADATLGVTGKIIAWLTYTLLFYSLMAAYVSGMGNLIQAIVDSTLHWHIHQGVGALFLIVLVGYAVYFGTSSVDYLNRLFFSCKVLTYIAVVIFLMPHVQLPQLRFTSVHHMWLALPIIVTSFGFQNVIPSLRVYLQDDIRKLRLAILIGSSIPLVVYIIWQFAIVGVVPNSGQEGLLSILASGQPATGLATAIDHILHYRWVATLFKAFTFFAIITSFTGVSFSLFDFVMDSFRIKKNMRGRFLALVITFLPSLVFAYLYPNGFILALGYAGIFVAILLGILPALMSWRGRCVKGLAVEGYKPRVNAFGYCLLIIFSTIIIVSQL